MIDRPNRKPHGCFDCDAFVDNYTVAPEVWLEAWPTYKEDKREAMRLHRNTPLMWLLLCFDCLEKRLGRPLKIEDFDLTIGSNQGIALGVRMAQHEASK